MKFDCKHYKKGETIMRSFIGNEYGRVLVMHLGKGELLLESIQSEIDRLGIKNGVLLSCIGSLRKCVFHVITTTTDDSVDEVLTLEEAIEVSAVQGLILDGKPHFHLVISDTNKAYTGHLENGCEVQYLMEIAIMEVKDLDLERRKDEFGILYIDKKNI